MNRFAKYTSSGSTSRHIADALHSRIDQAAERGEWLEGKLHDTGERIQKRSRRLNDGLHDLVRDRPYTVLGSSLALGMLLGALVGRRPHS